MNIFVTQDQTAYRRWINILPGLLIPGSSQFLSGRKTAGILWLITSFLLGAISLTLLGTTSSLETPGPLPWLSVIQILFPIGLAADACRQPILRTGFKKWAIFLFIFLFGIIVPSLTIRHFLIQTFKVPTGGMQPSIMGITTDENGNKLPGDEIILNKTAYWKQTPQRGDIVVFKTNGINYPNVKQSTVYIKRIVGLPGETISIDPPDILINGNPLKEPEIFTTITEGRNGYHGYTLALTGKGVDSILTNSEETITLAADEYLVLGDNSKTSLDSRYYGPIKKPSILGKVVYRYFPQHRKGVAE